MKKKRFSEEQIIGFLREADAGMAVKELCRKHGFSEASYCLWRNKLGGFVRSHSHFMLSFRSDSAHSRKYRLIRFWYGMPFFSDNPRK